MIGQEGNKIKNYETNNSSENTTKFQNESTDKINDVCEHKIVDHAEEKNEIMKNKELPQQEQLNENEFEISYGESKLQHEYKGHGGIKINSSFDDPDSMATLAIDPEELETGLKGLSVSGSSTNENIDGTEHRIIYNEVMDESCPAEDEKRLEEEINRDQYQQTKDVSENRVSPEEDDRNQVK